jgi:hypothetical protein
VEKAILKTLIYADLFDYPLGVWEIHKWLIGKGAILRQVEKALEKLRVKGKAERVKGYYFLQGRSGIVRKRKLREKQSGKFLRKAIVCAWLLKIIPWIRLVGISGGLAMKNSSKVDDIDLFIITAKDRLWLSRLFILGTLSLIGQRRMATHTKKEAAGKICPNILIDEDRLIQERKDLYTAHEVLQMKILWERDGTYSRYLEDNDWVFKFLPNWVAPDTSLRAPKGRGNLIESKDSHVASLLGMTVERVAKWLQLKIMKKSQGMERIEDGALYFHPHDMRPQVLDIYKQKVKNIISP